MRVYLLIYLLLGLVGALPVSPSGNTTHGIYRRQCVPRPNTMNRFFDCDMQMPSLTQIIQQMRNPPNGRGASAQRPAIFYTNLPFPSAILCHWCRAALGLQAQENHIQQNSATLHATYPEEWKKFPKNNNLSPNGLFRLCLFHALGAAAEHPDAYLFSPKDAQPHSGSAWLQIELPALTNNPKIQTIYQVDPRPAAWTGRPAPGAEGPLPNPRCAEGEPDQPTVIWCRARGDRPVDFVWNCPVGSDIWPVSLRPGETGGGKGGRQGRAEGNGMGGAY